MRLVTAGFGGTLSEVLLRGFHVGEAISELRPFSLTSRPLGYTATSRDLSYSATSRQLGLTATSRRLS